MSKDNTLAHFKVPAQAPMSAAQKLQTVRDQLLNAFIEKEDAQAKLDQANKTIIALRNVLAGVPVGQQQVREETPPPPSKDPQ